MTNGRLGSGPPPEAAALKSEDARMAETVADPKYVFRFFFDAGSGVCLWSANDAARERYEYAVDLESLPLVSETREAVEALLRTYDANFNWDDPGGPDLWSAGEVREFDRKARAVLGRLRTELGLSYEIRDELG